MTWPPGVALSNTCTVPFSASRPGSVEAEICAFKRLGKGSRIFAAIVDGEPHAAGKPGRTPEEECFPSALIYQVDARGALTNRPEPNEPIAADFRDGKDGRENGLLKIIAGPLDVGLDELVQREKQAERRRRLRANAIATAMAVLALGAVVAGVFALQAERSRLEFCAGPTTRRKRTARQSVGARGANRC